MKNFNEMFNIISTAFSSRTARVLIMTVVIALFVLSAPAPNGTIGIGK